MPTEHNCQGTLLRVVNGKLCYVYYTCKALLWHKRASELSNRNRGRRGGARARGDRGREVEAEVTGKCRGKQLGLFITLKSHRIVIVTTFLAL